MIKLPKGTQDYSGSDYLKINFLKDIATTVFEQFGGSPVETPIFERTDLLANKYGDEEKLIFNLENNVEGAEKEVLSLRYDQTIPFVRFVLCNGIKKMKRYSIGKVYRKETTNKKIKRLREFYQADFDFVGDFDRNLPEIQIFMMVNIFFSKIGIKNYTIRYNFMQLLYYYIVDKASVDKPLFKTICSSLDKLDKIGWDNVIKEWRIKGLTSDQVEIIKEYVQTMLISKDPQFIEIYNEFESLLKQYGITNCKFDTSLARGLDYYTGIIFEVCIDGFESSVAGGGRYDGLINKYDNKYDTPMMGFSLGLDRLMNFVQLPESYGCKANTIMVFTIIQGVSEEDIIKLNVVKVRVIKDLINFGFEIDFMFNDKSAKKQLSKISDDPKYIYAIIIGKYELENGLVSVKNLKTREQIRYNINTLGPELFRYMVYYK